MVRKSVSEEEEGQEEWKEEMEVSRINTGFAWNKRFPGV
jgi:hypothetical protein